MLVREILCEEDIHDYVDRLIYTLGIKRLGAGAFAHVFQHPKDPNIVVKVFNYASDYSYNKFLKWAQKNQHNPYVPKILSVRRIPAKDADVDDPIAVVFMRKLVKAPRAVYKKLHADALAALKAADSPAWKEAAQSRGTFQSWPAAGWAELAKVSPDKNFRDFCAFMVGAGDHDGDLHSENVMMDPSNGQIVFTDPVA